MTGNIRKAIPRVVAEQYGHGFDPFIYNRIWSFGKLIAGTPIGLDSAGNRPAAISFSGTAVDWQATSWPQEALPGTLSVRPR